MSGVIIPKGSLDRWRAARSSHASALAEVVYFGDSTGFGSMGGTLLGGPIRKMKDLAVAAGYTDGGRGVGSPNETATSSGDGLAPLVSSNLGGAGVANWFDFLYTDSPANDTTPGHSIVYQGKGTAVAIYYGIWPGNTGTFTYSIDGATAVTVNASSIPTGGPSLISIGVAKVSGLTEGTHTVTIVNGSGMLRGVVCDFTRSAGIVLHKQAVSGATIGLWFDPTTTQSTTFPNVLGQVALGLKPGLGTNGYDWGSAALTGGRRPSLALEASGINNQQGASSGTVAAAVTTVYGGTVEFCKMARTAGADPVVVLPHFRRSANNQWAGDFRAAKLQAAAEQSAAVVDLDYALDVAFGPSYTGGGGAPHLDQPGYDAEAQFMWGNLINT